MSKSKFITWEVTGENVQHGIPVGYTVELSPSPDFHPIVKTSTTFEEVSNVASRFSYSLDDQESWIGYPSGEGGLIFKQDYHMRYELRPSDLSYVFILRNNILYKYSSDLRYLIERYNLSSISPFLTLVPERLLLNDKNDNVYIFGDIVSRNQKRVFGFSTNPLIKPQRSIVLDKDVKVAIDGLRQSYYEFGNGSVYLRDFEGNLLYSFDVEFDVEPPDSSSSSESYIASTSSSYDGLELSDLEFSLIFEPDGLNEEIGYVTQTPSVTGTQEHGYLGNNTSAQILDGNTYYQYQNVTGLSNVAGNTSKTVMMWCYIDSEDRTRVTQYILYIGGSTTSTRTWFGMLNNSLYTEFSGSQLILNYAPPKKWVHIAMVYDLSAGFAYGYVDGVLLGSKADAGINSLMSPITIGALYNGSTSGRVKGGVNDFKIVNKPMDATEIAAYYYQSSKIYKNFPDLTEETSIPHEDILLDIHFSSDGYIDRSVIRHEILSDEVNLPSYDDTYKTFVFPDDSSKYMNFDKQMLWPVLLTRSRTVMCWVFVIGEDTNLSGQKVFAQMSSDFSLAANSLFYNFKNGLNSSMESTEYIRRGWVHLAGVSDFSNNMAYLYINGQLAVSKSSSAGLNSSGRPTIGNNDGLTGYGDAAIQDVKLLNTALSGTQISDYYNETVITYAAYPASLTTQSSISTDNLLIDLNFTSSGYIDRSKARTPARDDSSPPSYFDGYATFSTNQYLSMYEITALLIRGTAGKTIMGWVKQTAVDTNTQTIFMIGTASNGQYIRIEITSGANIYAYCNVGEEVTSSTDIGTNWTHFALTFDEGTEDAKLYINGSLESTDNWPSLNLQFQYFTIGSDYNQNNYLNASLNDFKILSETLSGPDILSYYNETSGDYA